MGALDNYLEAIKLAKKEQVFLENTSSEIKNKALEAISNALLNNIPHILEENKKDLELATNLSTAMLKRLTLTEEKIKAIASDTIAVSKLDDPVKEIIEEKIRPNGLQIKKVRVPFGVIAAIYESRPNVTIDIAVLCLKTGNACVLKGGSETLNTNRALVKLIHEAIAPYIKPSMVTLIDTPNREAVSELIRLEGLIDLVTSRGGAGLIDFVKKNALVPVIETGSGVCHTYVDESADLKMALEIAINAKVSNPSVCNSMETLLVNRKVASKFLPILKVEMEKEKVLLKGDSSVSEFIDVEHIEEDDYHIEYDNLILAIKVVDDVYEAVRHISKYSTMHSEAIVSETKENVEYFFNNIDAACLYHNASTRFTDGGCFGLGAELGISTQKLHARGPMGLKEMTSYKYLIFGNGQIR